MVDATAYTHFQASHRSAPAGTRLGPIDPATQVHVSVYLKPLHDETAPLSREDMAQLRADTHANGIRLVSEFAASTGLTVDSVEPARRLVRLSGTAAAAEAAFRTTLSRYQNGGREFQGREGTLQLPHALHHLVEAVLGLDTRAQAQTRSIVAHAVPTGYLPSAVGQLYNFSV